MARTVAGIDSTEVARGREITKAYERGERVSDHVVVWEFWVRSGEQDRFEEIYGSQGDWARLFVLDPAYRGTRLVRDVQEPRRYLTLDLWASREAYKAFREKHAAEYLALDRECANLTESEREIGRFSDLPS